MVDFDKLDELVEQGYLSRFEEGDLVGYGYTDKCTFERMWNEHTLNARGTVYRKSTGETVAKALSKFFNFGELSLEKQKKILAGEAPYDSYTIAEKMDGSLGIVYHDGEKWRVNTRGSFSSDQAIKATEMLGKYRTENFIEGETYLVEIIYPENKVIVDYGNEEKLVLLAGYDSTGEDLSPAALFLHSILLEMEIAPTVENTIEGLIELQKTIPKDEEGFVVRFSNGERVKFKGEEYLKIARILQGCSPLALWEKMENGKVCEEFLASIPEEIYPEIEPIVNTLEKNYQKVFFAIYYEFKTIVKKLQLYNNPEGARKELGLYMKNNKVVHHGAMFSILLGKKDAVEKYIMKQIRPKANVL